MPVVCRGIARAGEGHGGKSAQAPSAIDPRETFCLNSGETCYTNLTTNLSLVANQPSTLLL